MIRLRFEKASQIFECDNVQIVLPLDEIIENVNIIKQAEAARSLLIAEIPPLVFEDDVDAVKEKLSRVKELGVTDALAENIGAVNMAKEAGMCIHGGFALNILNSVSLGEYEALGLSSATLSAELEFSKVKAIKHGIPIGMITYGYLPMMKFRACPARAASGCGSCNGHPVITDRKNVSFNIICRGRKYSELLNCVPVYVGDKSVPKLDFEELYFTIESKEQCERIYSMYMEKAAPDFDRTAGLYFRELL